MTNEVQARVGVELRCVEEQFAVLAPHRIAEATCALSEKLEVGLVTLIDLLVDDLGFRAALCGETMLTGDRAGDVLVADVLIGL